MSSRDAILATVRANRPALTRDLPPIPRFDAAPPASLLDAFKTALVSMGGAFMELGEGDDPLAPLRERLACAGQVCSVVPEVRGNLTMIQEPRDLAEVDVGVVRAAFGVAETGSVCLTDEALFENALGYLPQHLIVLLDPADIVVNLHHAYDRSEFRRHRYAVFHTGPSATADIEGVLIRGAQGVRSLTVVPTPRVVPRSGALDAARRAREHFNTRGC